MDTFILFVVIVGGSLIYQLRRQTLKNRRRDLKNDAARVPRGTEDDMIIKIKNFREEMNDLVRRHEQQREIETLEARQLLTDAKDWVTKTGIADATYEVYRYFAWAGNRELLDRSNFLFVSKKKYSKTEDGGLLFFIYKNLEWNIELTMTGSYDNTCFGRLVVDVNGFEVAIFSVFEDISPDAKAYGSSVHCGAGEKLIVGDWATQVIEMAVILDANQKMRLADQKAQELITRSRGIKM